MKNIQVTVTAQGSGKNKNARIVLEGELILRYLQEATEEIKKAFGKFDKVTLELKNIVTIDLACIQLLLSARQTAISSGKVFTCQTEFPEEIHNILAHSGLAHLPALLNEKDI